MSTCLCCLEASILTASRLTNPPTGTDQAAAFDSRGWLLLQDGASVLTDLALSELRDYATRTIEATNGATATGAASAAFLYTADPTPDAAPALVPR